MIRYNMSYNIKYTLYDEIMIFAEKEYESEINNFELILSLVRYCLRWRVVSVKDNLQRLPASI